MSNNRLEYSEYNNHCYCYRCQYYEQLRQKEDAAMSCFTLCTIFIITPLIITGGTAYASDSTVSQETKDKCLIAFWTIFSIVGFCIVCVIIYMYYVKLSRGPMREQKSLDATITENNVQNPLFPVTKLPPTISCITPEGPLPSSSGLMTV